jgi:hypothetical protein
MWVEAAHGPFVLFLISLFVPEHVHVHVHPHGAQPEAEAIPESEGWVGYHLGLDLLVGEM